ALRRELLAGFAALPEAPGDADLRAIFGSMADGRAKLYVTWRLLALRKAREALFADGAYAPLRTGGDRARHAIAFARRRGKETAITVAPRLAATLGVQAGELPCGAIWGDTRVEIPFLGAEAELRDAITGRV